MSFTNWLKYLESQKLPNLEDLLRDRTAYAIKPKPDLKKKESAADYLNKTDCRKQCEPLHQISLARQVLLDKELAESAKKLQEAGLKPELIE